MKLESTNEKVTIKWFVVDNHVKYPREASMRGAWGYDVECSCGWQTNTGGAVKSWMQDEVKSHKIQDHNYTYKVGA